MQSNNIPDVNMTSIPHPALLLDLAKSPMEDQIKFSMTILYSIIESADLQDIDKDFLGFFDCDGRNIDTFDITHKLNEMDKASKLSTVIHILANVAAKID